MTDDQADLAIIVKRLQELHPKLADGDLDPFERLWVHSEFNGLVGCSLPEILADWQRLRAERGKLQEGVMTLLGQRDRILIERDAARAVLKEVEWGGIKSTDGWGCRVGTCLFCEHLCPTGHKCNCAHDTECQGHAPDCRLAANLPNPKKEETNVG